ncbi:DciA family protein [Glutamicibacter arilaitensis]|uniref:DciA family protein n=1 Tax=Glutamicibacter arilaitensis TaxID=256701 RepID=UPI003FD5FA03
MSVHSDAMQTAGDFDAPMALLNRMRTIAQANGHVRIDAERMAKIKRRKNARKAAEERPSSAEGAARDPKLLGGVFSQLSKKYGWEAGLSAGRVLACWESIVPPAIGSACKAEGMDGKTLVVRCENASWVAQMKLHERQLVDLLCKQLGEGAVESIKAMAGNKTYPGNRR